MSLQTHSLDTVSPGVKTVKKPFRKLLVLFAAVRQLPAMQYQCNAVIVRDLM